ncbi:hypothetical protein HDU76_003226, partial [Blyttiomyces sp. JEL0837]
MKIIDNLIFGSNERNFLNQGQNSNMDDDSVKRVAPPEVMDSQDNSNAHGVDETNSSLQITHESDKSVIKDGDNNGQNPVSSGGPSESSRSSHLDIIGTRDKVISQIPTSSSDPNDIHSSGSLGSHAKKLAVPTSAEISANSLGSGIHDPHGAHVTTSTSHGLHKGLLKNISPSRSGDLMNPQSHGSFPRHSGASATGSTHVHADHLTAPHPTAPHPAPGGLSHFKGQHNGFSESRSGEFSSGGASGRNSTGTAPSGHLVVGHMPHSHESEPRKSHVESHVESLDSSRRNRRRSSTGGERLSRVVSTSTMRTASKIGKVIQSKYVERSDKFYEKRKLAHGKANMWHMLAVIWGLQLAGATSGWQVILENGWGSGVAAIGIVCIAYWCVAVLLAELSTMLPFTGGMAIYARAAFGPFIGYIVGQCEMWEYGLTSASNMVVIGEICELVFGTASNLQPIYWVLLMVVLYVQQALGSSFFFNSVAVLSAYSTIVILVTNLMLIKFMNVQYWAMDDIYSNLFLSTDQNSSNLTGPAFAKAVNHEAGLLWGFQNITGPIINETFVGNETAVNAWALSELFPYGFMGVIQCIPDVVVMFLGIECLPLMTEESREYTKNAPNVLFYCMGLATLLLPMSVIVTAAVAPGSTALGDSIFPVVDALDANFGVSLPTVVNIIIMFVYVPTVVISTTCSNYACTRQIFGLARTGYMPTVVAWTELPGKKEPIPWVAGIVSTVQTIVLA